MLMRGQHDVSRQHWSEKGNKLFDWFHQTLYSAGCIRQAGSMPAWCARRPAGVVPPINNTPNPGKIGASQIIRILPELLGENWLCLDDTSLDGSTCGATLVDGILPTDATPSECHPLTDALDVSADL